MLPNSDVEPTGDAGLPVARTGGPRLLERTVALLEVLICSDYPTQYALAATFAMAGFRPFARDGNLAVGYVVWLSLLDTALLVGLILLCLRAHGERPRDVFLGVRPPAAEAIHGLPLALVAVVIGVGVLAAIQEFLPSLHTVLHNPLQDLIRRPRDAWLFAFVVVVAGGVREEVQRAFLLHRFETWLGGSAVGIVITSAVFGSGHLLQGEDAAIATGVLGAFWGIVYLRRRSIVAPAVSHSGFNLLQIVQFLMLGR